MTIGINPSIQHIYPAAISLQPEATRRQQDFNELSEHAQDRAHNEKVRRVHSSASLNSSFDQARDGQRFHFHQSSQNFTENDRRTATNADVLLQMIQRMGGAGVYNGPGQTFNFVV